MSGGGIVQLATTPALWKPRAETREADRWIASIRTAERELDHPNRLAGRIRVVARVTWLVVVLATLGTFVLALPARWAQLTITLNNLSPAQRLVLQDWGVSIEQHARLVFAVEIAVPLGFLAVGLLIFARRSDDWVAMLVALASITYSVWLSPPLRALSGGDPAWRIPVALVQIVGMLTAASCFFVFPSGRLVPRWSGLMIGVCGLWGGAWLAFPGSLFDLSNPFRVSLLAFGLSMTWWAAGIGAQIYRYTVATSVAQRRQTKLVVFALGIGVVAYLVFGFDRFALPIFIGPFYASVVYDLIGVPIFQVITLVIPLAFAFSILRHRLWEIEVFVNRALVYGALTAVVAGLFPATMTTCQRLFTYLTGEKSDVVMIVVTLIFASSLTPMKNQLQRLVDRYVASEPDPAASVRAFSAQIRSVVDLLDVEEVTRRALDETLRAFGATTGAVYLYRQGHLEPAHVRGGWTQEEGMAEWLEYAGARYGWIAIAPRADGVSYAPRDQEIFGQTVGLVARTIHLIGAAGLEPVDAGPTPAEEHRNGGN
jgi:hypothetical protein